VLQGVLLVAVGAAGFMGSAWDGPSRAVAVVAGATLLVAGGILAMRGIVDLREALTPLPHPRDGADLVDTGAYRLVRHPIYGGIVIGAAGYALLTASPLALAGAAILLGFFRLKSAREEAWLAARYPAYPEYRSRTRRMLPYLY